MEYNDTDNLKPARVRDQIQHDNHGDQDPGASGHASRSPT